MSEFKRSQQMHVNNEQLAHTRMKRGKKKIWFQIYVQTTKSERYFSRSQLKM